MRLWGISSGEGPGGGTDCNLGLGETRSSWRAPGRQEGLIIAETNIRRGQEKRQKRCQTGIGQVFGIPQVQIGSEEETQVCASNLCL